MDWDYANGSGILAEGVCVHTLTTADVLLLLVVVVVVVVEGYHLEVRSRRKTLSLRYVWGG
jgi:hypothetical protein